MQMNHLEPLSLAYACIYGKCLNEENMLLKNSVYNVATVGLIVKLCYSSTLKCSGI